MGGHNDPIFRTHQDRLAAIMDDLSGSFGFDSENPYPGHEEYTDPIYARDRTGDRAVTANLSDIR